MFIDKEEEEKKAKELEKNAVAITWDLLVFEDVWSLFLLSIWKRKNRSPQNYILDFFENIFLETN